MPNEGRQPGKCAAVYRLPQPGSFSLYGIPEQPGIDETVSLVKGIPPLDLVQFFSRYRSISAKYS